MQHYKQPYKNTTKFDNVHNLWCRDTMWQYVADNFGLKPTDVFKQTNGCNLRRCNKSDDECRGAHSKDTIQPLPHIEKFNKLNKSKYNWVKLYLDVKQVLQNDLAKLFDVNHKQYLTELSTMDFISMIQLWRNMSCIYRKLAKELPSNIYSGIKIQSNSFTYSEEVPKFMIPTDGLEDIAWAFERLTRQCSMNQLLISNIKSNIKITIWDMCLATGINCKEGVHEINEMVCKDDFITGSCTCQSLHDYNKKTGEFEKEISELNEQLQTLPDGKQANKIARRVRFVCEQLQSHIGSRLIHYTEIGMIPFEQQYQEYQITEQKRIEQQRVAENIDIIPVTHVTKLGKLAKKK